MRTSPSISDFPNLTFKLVAKKVQTACITLFFCLTTHGHLSAFTWTYGSYTGDGVDGRSISGMSFQPDIVIVKSTTTHASNIRTSSMPANNSKDPSSASAFITTGIKSFHSTGFTIGTSATVNNSGTTYNFIAIQETSSEVIEGTYTGDGNLLGKNITSVGFSPKFVIVYSASEVGIVSQDGAWVMDFVNSGPQLYFNGYLSNGFILFSGDYNVSGRTYYYIAFNNVTNYVATGSYSGNSFADQNISTGFAPGYVLSRAWGSYYALQKTPTMGSTAASYFNATANSNSQITAFGTTYFTVKAASNASQTGSSHSYIAFGNPSPLLPVELNEFSASCEKEGVYLNWSTFTETQNDYFTLERSEDGILFQPIAYIDGYGSSHEEKLYSYIDHEAIEQKTNYYRLKQTDLDGNFRYYKTITSTCSENLNEEIYVSHYPNTEEVMLYIPVGLKTNMEIHIFDMNGKKVWQAHYKLTESQHEIHFKPRLPSNGIYILQVTGDKMQFHTKLIY